MGLDAALDAVPDRTDGQFAFERSEGGFHFGKLHVLAPKGFFWKLRGILSAGRERYRSAGH
jgi:hypothetical protein